MNAKQDALASPTPLRILVTARFAADIESVIDIPHVLTTFSDETDEGMSEKLYQTEVFVSSVFRAAWASGGTLPLRLIHGVGAGTDGIDMTAVPAGCRVCNVYGHAHAVTEYTFMVMTALNRQLLAQDAALRQGDWGGGVFRAGLQGRILLVLGLGHIGAEVVRWGQFMGMAVIGLTRLPSPERARQLGLATIGGLDGLYEHLPTADFVVIAIPHTAETDGFIGAAELRQMKPSAFLINVARGPVVDEASLYAALAERSIAGAAVDVWYRYPTTVDEKILPSRYPYHKLDNIIMTPHNAGLTDGTMAYRFAFIAENLRRLVANEPLQNVVWPVENK